MRVLVTAYDCCPGKGSEHAMGWHLITELSKYGALTVITRQQYREDILTSARSYQNIEWHFVKEPSLKQILPFLNEMWDFYLNYKKWERKAYKLAIGLHQQQPFAIVHRINIIGVKEPGFMWQLNQVKFIMGPAGGLEYISPRFFSQLSWVQLGKALLNNLLVFRTRYLHTRLRKAVTAAKHIYTFNSHHQELFAKIFKQPNTSVLADSATFQQTVVPLQRMENEPLRLVVACRLEEVKGIQLIARALALLPASVKYNLTVIGTGSYAKRLEAKLNQFGIHYSILGAMPRHELFNTLRQQHLFVYASFKDANTHIIPEAISCGCPVVCLHHLGYGDYITDDIGVRIPVSGSLQHICSNMASEITKLYDNENRRVALAYNCLAFAAENTWQKVAQAIFTKYRALYES